MRKLLLLTMWSILACGGGADVGQAARKAAGTAEKTEAAPAEAAPAAKATEAPVARGLRATPLDPARMPRQVQVTGEVVGGLDYSDSSGQHLLVLSQVAPHGGDEKSAELYAYDWHRVGPNWSQVWKIQDFVKDCPNDLSLAFVQEATAVADNDQDGTAETLVLYRLGCRGDVSPLDQKLLVHEGETKWALRGLAGIEMGDIVEKSSYTADFPGAPAATLAWAEQQWSRFDRETSP